MQVGFDPRVLTEGKVDVLAVFKSNEPNVVRKLGHEVVLWDPADFDVPNMGLTYITTNAYASDSSDVLDRFLRATLKGTEYALENREETLGHHPEIRAQGRPCAPVIHAGYRAGGRHEPTHR